MTHRQDRDRACYYLWRRLHHREDTLSWVLFIAIAAIFGLLLGWRG